MTRIVLKVWIYFQVNVISSFSQMIVSVLEAGRRSHRDHQGQARAARELAERKERSRCPNERTRSPAKHSTPWATTGTRNLGMHPSFTGPGPRGSPPAQILESLVLMKARLMDSEPLLKQPACNVRGPRVVLCAARKRLHRVLNAGCSILLRDGQQLADTPHHRSWTRAPPYSPPSLMATSFRASR
jgi:hypothetical protein